MSRVIICTNLLFVSIFRYLYVLYVLNKATILSTCRVTYQAVQNRLQYLNKGQSQPETWWWPYLVCFGYSTQIRMALGRSPACQANGNSSEDDDDDLEAPSYPSAKLSAALRKRTEIMGLLTKTRSPANIESVKLKIIELRQRVSTLEAACREENEKPFHRDVLEDFLTWQND